MSTFRHLAVLALASVCAACATTGNTNSAAPAAQTAGDQEVHAEAIVGQPAPGSKFTQLTIGMNTQAVQQIDPDAQVRIDRVSGKVDVDSTAPREALAAAIAEEGYTVAA